MPNGNQETNWWLRGLETLFPPARMARTWEEEGLRWPWQQPAPAPAPPAQLTWGAGEALRGMDYPIPPGVTFPEPTPVERYEAWKEAQVPLVDGDDEAPGFETFAEAQGSLPNENWEVYKNEFGRFDVRRKAAPPPMPTGLTPAQKASAELAEREFRQRQAQWEWEKQQAGQVSPYQQQQYGLQQQQMAQQQQQFGLQEQQFAEQQAQFQQQLEFQQTQAQAAQEEQERQYMSQLAAQPINWLQYAAYTGQPPVVQPWMQPLGFQEAEGALPPGVEVGQPIPGFQGQAGQQGMQTFAGLPQLRTPSAQLQARWGPTAQAQFLGYRQARTGAAPEETQFRLGAGRAPTGAFGGFSRFR